MLKTDEIVLESKGGAEAVLNALHSLLEQYERVSFADFLELCGIASTFTDNMVGWTKLDLNIEIKEDKGGFILDLPAPQPI